MDRYGLWSQNVMQQLLPRNKKSNPVNQMTTRQTNRTPTRFASISVVVFPTSRTQPIDSIIDGPKKHEKWQESISRRNTRNKKKRTQACMSSHRYFIGAFGTTTATRVDEQLNWWHNSTTNKTRDGIVVSCQASLLWVNFVIFDAEDNLSDQRKFSQQACNKRTEMTWKSPLGLTNPNDGLDTPSRAQDIILR